MTRNGKIARLPRQVREQLNRRLDDGEPGTELVAWLNTLPEVQALLQAEFAGRPISEQNLSEWKQGGFRDWQRQQESLALALELCAQSDELAKVAGESLGDRLAPLLIARYMAVLRTLGTDSGGDSGDWKMLHELCGDIVALRKGDHSAERLRFDRERLRLGLGS